MANWLTVENNSDPRRIKLTGSWRLAHLNEIAGEIAAARINPSERAIVDGGGLSELDTSGAMMIFKAVDASNDSIQFESFSEDKLSILQLVRGTVQKPAKLASDANLNFLQRVGESTVQLGGILARLISFIGETTAELGQTLACPRRLRIRELFAQLEVVCLDAIPIVCLVTFLIGVVLAYLFGIQIEKYGGNIFIVDSVSLAMCRELSPILVAIIVAGRSGSAFTAQIGAMKLNEELDALVTLGLSPMRILVLPRVIALMIAMPILVFVGDVVGIFGGMLIADLRLGVSGLTFIERVRTILPVRSFLVGLGKAPVFALFIAVIGCHLGMVVENNARSLGMNTTSTVVRSIVAVILLNAVFAVVLQQLGI